MPRPPASRPLVGIPCDFRMLGPHPFHAVGEKYILAVERGANALPLLVPVLPTPLETAELLSRVDGILFTGSPSNVAPEHYSGPPPRDGVLQDPMRDRTTLPLMRAAIDAGIPVLSICRGFQEMNVVFGGSLHQHLEEQADHFDHRADPSLPVEVQYGPAHDVKVTPGGMLARILDAEKVSCTSFRVNSLHGQGIDRLGEGLMVEAVAEDGVVEAVSVPAARGFAFAVQWHPEWQFWLSGVSTAIFNAFGKAVAQSAMGRARAAERV